MMLPVQYHPIGVVESPIHSLLRLEELRGMLARLRLEPRFAPVAVVWE